MVSTRGRTGGFRLARPADQISFADVIRIFDGQLALTPCASQTRPGPCVDCVDPVACSIRPALIEARDQVAAVLERTTLAIAISGTNSSAGMLS